jgi:hypothetical protein
MGRPAKQPPKNKAFEPRHVVQLVGCHALQRLKDRTAHNQGGGCWHCSGDCYLQFKDKECEIIQWRRSFSALTPERQDMELCQMFFETVPGGLTLQQSSLSRAHSTSWSTAVLQGEWENEEAWACTQVDTSSSDENEFHRGTVSTSSDDNDMDAISLPDSACTSSQPCLSDQDTLSQSGDSSGAPPCKRAKRTKIGQAQRGAGCSGQTRRRQWSLHFLGLPVCQIPSSSHTFSKRNLACPRHHCSSSTRRRWNWPLGAYPQRQSRFAQASKTHWAWGAVAVLANSRAKRAQLLVGNLPFFS